MGLHSWGCNFFCSGAHYWRRAGLDGYEDQTVLVHDDRMLLDLDSGLLPFSSLCLYGVVLYLQKAHIGYWNEYLMASRWGRFCWPLSLAEVILAAIGKGCARVLLTLAGIGLVVVWTMAFVH